MFIFNVKLFLCNNEFCYSIKNKITKKMSFLILYTYIFCFKYCVWTQYPKLVHQQQINNQFINFYKNIFVIQMKNIRS